MEIQEIEISKLKEYENNARFHGDEQLKQIEDSIIEFGFTNPVLIDEDDIIIAGHGRKLAAIGIGMDKIPCIRLIGLSDAQKKALRIADNRLPQNAQWDIERLTNEVNNLYNEGYNLNYTGFTDDEINKLLESIKMPDDIEKEKEDIEKEIESETNNDIAAEINKPENVSTNVTTLKIQLPSEFRAEFIDYIIKWGSPASQDVKIIN